MTKRQETMNCDWCGKVTLLTVLGSYYPFKTYFQCKHCSAKIVLEKEFKIKLDKQV